MNAAGHCQRSTIGRAARNQRSSDFSMILSRLWNKPRLLVALISALASGANPAQAGNPVFPGWYADPEGVVIDRMEFDENGFIKPVRMTFEGVQAIRADQLQSP